VVLSLIGIKTIHANIKFFFFSIQYGNGIAETSVFVYFQMKIYVKSNFNVKNSFLKYFSDVCYNFNNILVPCIFWIGSGRSSSIRSYSCPVDFCICCICCFFLLYICSPCWFCFQQNDIQYGNRNCSKLFQCEKEPS